MNRRGFLQLLGGAAAMAAFPLPQAIVWEPDAKLITGPIVGLEAITREVSRVFNSCLPRAYAVANIDRAKATQLGVDARFRAGEEVRKGDIEAFGYALAHGCREKDIARFSILPADLPRESGEVALARDDRGISLRGAMFYAPDWDAMMLRFDVLGVS